MSFTNEALLREWHRLEEVSRLGSSGLVLIARFGITTDGVSAADVLDRVRQVLRVVNEASRGEWPTAERWKQILPEWFVRACSVEPTEEEEDEWLKHWGGLPERERQKALESRTWSLASWLYWMHPDERAWYWTRAEVESDKAAVIDLEVDALPFPWGAFAWVVKVAGATRVVLMT